MLIGNTRIGGIGSLSIKNTYDPDALAYLTAVEAADGQALENSVKIAINTFVVGCKADGIWDAIVASCIMAGARTHTGALVPLKGIAPTNNAFGSGDYSRKLGLLGDASTKYLATGYNNNESGSGQNFPQDNSHMSVYVTSVPSLSASAQIFCGTIASIGSYWYIAQAAASSSNLQTKGRTGTTTTQTITGQGQTIGFKALYRDNSASCIVRSSQTNTSTSVASVTPLSATIGVFASGTGASKLSARMSFYSLGKALTLSSLDSRITTLMTTLNALL